MSQVSGIMSCNKGRAKCLCCNADSDQVVLQTVVISENFSSARSFDRKSDKSRPSTVSDPGELDSQISVYLLLRKVLRLRKSFLGLILQNTGRGLTEWNLKLCEICHRIFEEASFVWSRLRKLEEEFEGLSERLRCKVVKSYLSGTENDGKLLKTPEGLYKRLRSGRKAGHNLRKGTNLNRGVEVKTKVAYDVADEIRDQFIRQHNGQINKPGVREDAMESDKLTGSMTSDTLDSIAPNKLSVNETVENSVKPKNLKHAVTMFVNGLSVNLDDGEVGDSESNEAIAEKDLCIDEDYSPNSPDADESDEDKDDEVPESVESDGSEYLPENYTSKRQRKSRPELQSSIKEQGLILRAMKREDYDDKYECPKCSKIFDNSTMCNEHIMFDHYSGNWPQHHRCPICEDCSFKSENRLRVHLKMRHPGVTLSVDELLEQSVREGAMQELTYDVVSIEDANDVDISSHNEQLDILDDNSQTSKLEEVTSDETTPHAHPWWGLQYEIGSLSVPVMEKNGEIRKINLPVSFSSLPESVLNQLREGPDQLNCHLCEQKFIAEVQLKSHIKRSHEGERYSYTCPMCPNNFERIGHMLRHMQRAHTTSGGFNCNKCGRIFNEDILLNAHIQRVHYGIDRPYRCVKCGQRHPRRASLNNHLKTVHKLRLVSHSTPPKRKGMHPGVRNKKVPKKATKLEKKFACETCESEKKIKVRFATEEELDIHFKRIHLGISRPYPCPICNKKYSRPCLVKNHMHTHTVRTDYEYSGETDEEIREAHVCVQCGKEFNSKAALAVHLQGRNHVNYKPYVCEICSQTFGQLRYLQNHQSLKHYSELNVEPNKCKYCNKILSSTRSLDDHIRIHHTKNAKFRCSYCNALFQYPAALKRHVNVRHTKSDKYLCPHCPKAFTHPQYLTNHIRIHTGEKPFQCTFCFKKFSDKPTYNRHVEAHSAVTHKCPICDKTGFKTRHALGVHMKLHKGGSKLKSRIKNSMHPQPPPPVDAGLGLLSGEDYVGTSHSHTVKQEAGISEILNNVDDANLLTFGN